MPSELRPYQLEAAEAVEMHWDSVRSTLIVCPTATGKTRIATEVLARRKATGRALFLAQREELIEQAARAVARDAELTTDVEMAEKYAAVQPDMYSQCSDVVVASVQSLHENRLRRWPRDAFSTIIVDEGHHAISPMHRRILDHFGGAKVLGLTATPDRADEVGLRAVFETCAYSYEIRTAIQEGWIVPIRMMQIECADLDISEVRTVRGDLSESELEQALSVDKVLHQIAGPLVREAGDRSTIVFTAGVQQAHALAVVLAGYTSARIVSADGTTNKVFRREVVEDFKAGNIQFLLNCALFTEGFDCPRTSCIAMARPTKSRALLTQCVGRGFRLSPDTGKTDLLVLDFVGNAGRHSLVSPLDVLAGKALSDDVRGLAEENARSGMDLEGALSAAEREAEERERRRREQARARVQADIAYRMREVNPFGEAKYRQPFEVLGIKPPTEVADVARRITDAQQKVFEKFGIELPKETPRHDASNMLDALFARRRKNLCTYKQARLLARYGLRTNLYFKEASEAIDAIAKAGWRCPPDIWERFGKRDTERRAG